MKLPIHIFYTLFLVCILLSCSSNSEEPTTDPVIEPTPEVVSDISFWLTTGDQNQKLTKQSTVISFTTTANNHQSITIDPTKTYQVVDGFGFTLTGGSVEAIQSLSETEQQSLLLELFGKEEESISISYLRISIGASDLNENPFTYNDIPEGETDLELKNFSLEKDQKGVIALLKDIIAINPDIKIMATPWTAPTWMKDNKDFIGGQLLEEFYAVYSNYFVKYIQAMNQEGISIDAITIQNEPLHDGNNPSMYMTAAAQALFIKDYLGPAFKQANIETKIIAWDHNCDHPEYPIEVLSDSEAYTYIDGSAFHLYAGDISALATVHNAFPEKNVYFTEQYTSSDGSFDGDLKWHLKNVIIGSMRNWSKNALEWNLANNEHFQPHTPGGCTVCKGGITIDSSGKITRNVGYYIVAHASKFIPEGSTRIQSNMTSSLENVAFITPEGKTVIIVLNNGNQLETFNIKHLDQWFTTSLASGAVGTFVWE
ncbi:glycoside hydrolase family 30 protein [Galbibacter sp.]|uniref:glycoside hydrolase family 30 protein n=1 Tax=Galbibacter sp. TaxID=2918471 RepID=UPI003A9410DA